ncbi:MAG: GTP cyclohydrolase 1 [Bathelium mastoideum]|nr:MAG: GTP cyclohydrolase 1 [Bathelium mastoideum]
MASKSSRNDIDLDGLSWPALGEDPDREGLTTTPMLMVMKNATFQEDHSEMIIVKDIEVVSYCQHHLVSFSGKVHIGYIPNSQVIGLSKIPRIVEMYVGPLSKQGRFTEQVAQAVFETIRPQGVFVVAKGKHVYVGSRGARKPEISINTSCQLGCFRTSAEMRADFWRRMSLSLFN